MIERVSTYIAGFDELIEGGFPKGSITLISGMPGTGKSIFCAQILYNNVLKGKKCLYLNLEQDSGRLETQMKELGWNPDTVKKNLKIAAVDSSDPSMVEYVLDEIKKLNYDLVVLDSLDSISSTPLSTDEIGRLGIDQISDMLVPTVMDAPMIGRMKLKKIFAAIAQSKATAFLTSEKVENAPGISRDTISEFLCDGIVTLNYIEIGVADYRTMLIQKLRNSDHYKGIVPYNITKKGIEILVSELKKR